MPAFALTEGAVAGTIRGTSTQFRSPRIQTGATERVMRTSEHPSAEALEAFVSGKAEGTEAQRVEDHLIAGCVRCLRRMHREVAEARRRAAVRRGLRMPSDERGRGVYINLDVIRRRTLSVDRQALLIEAERIVAPHLLRDLLLLPEADRRSVVRAGERFGFYGVTELLIGESRSECFRDVARAVELGRLAVESAEALSVEPYPPGLVIDARALAWAALGNTHRVRADLIDAERAMRTAWELVENGSGDRIARAEVLSLVGSLRMDQARFDEAIGVLTEAVQIFRAEGNRPQEGKLLVKLANVQGEVGDVDAAVALAAEARSLLREAEERLYLLAGQTLATWLREANRVEEARVTFDDLEPQFRARISDPTSLIRLDWLGARLLWSEGDHEGAERKLLSVRERYEDRGEPKRSCLVSLDLATLYLEQGRTREVRALARQMAPVFSSRQVHHHALAALVLFKQAAEAEKVSLGFVRELARYLQQSHRNPYLKFQPSEA